MNHSFMNFSPISLKLFPKINIIYDMECYNSINCTHISMLPMFREIREKFINVKNKNMIKI